MDARKVLTRCWSGAHLGERCYLNDGHEGEHTRTFGPEVHAAVNARVASLTPSYTEEQQRARLAESRRLYRSGIAF